MAQRWRRTPSLQCNRVVKHETQIFPVHFTRICLHRALVFRECSCMDYFTTSIAVAIPERSLVDWWMCNVALLRCISVSKCTFSYRLLHSKLIKMLRWTKTFEFKIFCIRLVVVLVLVYRELLVCLLQNSVISKLPPPPPHFAFAARFTGIIYEHGLLCVVWFFCCCCFSYCISTASFLFENL